jgi:hypothetical protein
MIVTMAKNIKWVERPSRESRRVEKKIDLLWMKPGELANVVEIVYVGKGWNRQSKTKVLGSAVIINIHMPGMRGYSEVLWNGVIHAISHAYLRPADE